MTDIIYELIWCDKQLTRLQNFIPQIVDGDAICHTYIIANWCFSKQCHYWILSLLKWLFVFSICLCKYHNSNSFALWSVYYHTTSSYIVLHNVIIAHDFFYCVSSHEQTVESLNMCHSVLVKMLIKSDAELKLNITVCTAWVNCKTLFFYISLIWCKVDWKSSVAIHLYIFSFNDCILPLNFKR